MRTNPMMMTRRLRAVAMFAIGASVSTVACAHNPAPSPEPTTRPASRPPASAPDVPLPTPPRIIPDARLVADSNSVPPFADSVAVRWGPEPPGTVHTFPPHEYDLLNQAVRVRFEWPLHAVVGSTTLKVAARGHAISVVPLDAVAMTIKGVAAGKVPLRYDYDGKILTVHLRRLLQPHAVTSFTVDYETIRPKRGAYFIDRNHYMWTQGAAIENRYWLPTYDHPDDKTTWSISVTTDSGEKALSNGRLVSHHPVKGGVVWNWELDHPASTYLMSVVTGKYTVLTDHWRNVPVEYWTYPDSVAAARLGFGATPDAIDVFSRIIGVPYQWSKYAQSVAPDFIFGGMENVTATTQNDNGILHPAWADPQHNADGLVSHELSHQWFGDLLTTRDWSHAWLNEGFATFMEQTYRLESRGVDEATWDRLGAERQAISADIRNRRPIVYNKYRTDPIELFFSGQIYPKGATVLQMLRHQLGDSTFWRAIHHYTESHMFGNVVTSDLEQALEESTSRDFTAFFKQWVYGAGFPVFRVSSSYDSVSRSLSLHANEIQPRDSLTGFFDVDVDVEVLTAGDATRGSMRVRNGSGDLTLRLASRPLAIEWNRGAWVLGITDFPRSTAMLDYQLAHSADVASRSAAITLLAKRRGDLAAVNALATAARSDKFWALRSAALHALAGFANDSSARTAVMESARDADSRIRQAAAGALSAFAGTGTDSLLRAMSLGDTSPIVSGVALASYLTLRGDSGLPLARTVMARSSWRNVLRTPALAVLRKMDGPAAQALYRKYAAR
jgi:aminopeptidase N